MADRCPPFSVGLASEADRLEGQRRPLTENHTEAEKDTTKEQAEHPDPYPFDYGGSRGNGNVILPAISPDAEPACATHQL